MRCLLLWVLLLAAGQALAATFLYRPKRGLERLRNSGKPLQYMERDFILSRQHIPTKGRHVCWFGAESCQQQCADVFVAGRDQQ
jgi:hypothetical protein